MLSVKALSPGTVTGFAVSAIAGSANVIANGSNSFVLREQTNFMAYLPFEVARFLSFKMADRK